MNLRTLCHGRLQIGWAIPTWDEAEARQLLAAGSFGLMIIGDHPPELDAAAILRDLGVQVSRMRTRRNRSSMAFLPVGRFPPLFRGSLVKESRRGKSIVGLSGEVGGPGSYIGATRSAHAHSACGSLSRLRTRRDCSFMVPP